MGDLKRSKMLVEVRQAEKVRQAGHAAQERSQLNPTRKLRSFDGMQSFSRFKNLKFLACAVVCIVWFGGATVSFAADLTPAHENLNQAISLYDDGDFLGAEGLFRSVALSDSPASDINWGYVFYNLGNSYYKTGNVAGALASYLHAKKFIPRDADLAANIKKTTNFVKDKVDLTLPGNQYSHILPLLDFLSTSEIDWLFGVLIFLLASASFMIKSRDLRSIGSVCLVGAVVLSCLYFGVRLVKTNFGIDYAVSSTSKLGVVSSPGQAGVELFKVSQGTPLRIVQEAGPYINIIVPEVSSETLKRGWVKKSDVISYRKQF